MSVRAVTPYVRPHRLVMQPMQPYRDADFYDLERDDWLCPTVWDEDAPAPSTRRGARTRSVTPAPPAGTGHDAPSGEPSSLAAGPSSSRGEGS
jgi:hypothetical protein